MGVDPVTLDEARGQASLLIGLSAAPPPSGSDDTAAVLAAAGANNTIKLGVGTYKLALGALTRFDIEGQGADLTYITPFSATNPIVTGGGAGDKTDDRARLAHLSLTMTADRTYDKPLIDFSLSRNVVLEDIGADVDTRIGTLFRFNAAYQWQFKDVHVRGGKWVVPVEFLNTTNLPSTGSPPQCDTMKFEQFVNDGCIGAIFRNANNDVHGIGLDGFKVVQTNFYPTVVSQETTLNGAHSAAATSVVVASATGIVAGDVLTIDLGRDTCEVVRVAASYVSGTTIPLHASTPLRYAHATAAEIFRGGFCLSIADGYENITIQRWHAEGQLNGAGFGNVRGIEFIEPYFGSGRHIQVCDATREIAVRRPTMVGTANKNELLRRSTNNASSLDGEWSVEDPIVQAGVTITPNIPAGYFPHNTRTWSWTGLLASARCTITNTLTSSASARVFSTGPNGATGQSGGQDKAWVTYGGRGVFSDGVQGKYVSGAGKTTVVDGDFTTTPTDGAEAVHYDSTASKTYKSVRANGTWHVIAGPV